MSNDLKEKVSERNAVAIAETLVHHGKCIGQLEAEINSLHQQIALLRTEMEQQKQLIVRSLQQKYGHGSTS